MSTAAIIDPEAASTFVAVHVAPAAVVRDRTHDSSARRAQSCTLSDVTAGQRSDRSSTRGTEKRATCCGASLSSI